MVQDIFFYFGLTKRVARGKTRLEYRSDRFDDHRIQVILRCWFETSCDRFCYILCFTKKCLKAPRRKHANYHRAGKYHAAASTKA